MLKRKRDAIETSKFERIVRTKKNIDHVQAANLPVFMVQFFDDKYKQLNSGSVKKSSKLSTTKSVDKSSTTTSHSLLTRLLSSEKEYIEKSSLKKGESSSSSNRNDLLSLIKQRTALSGENNEINEKSEQHFETYCEYREILHHYGKEENDTRIFLKDMIIYRTQEKSKMDSKLSEMEKTIASMKSNAQEMKNIIKSKVSSFKELQTLKSRFMNRCEKMEKEMTEMSSKTYSLQEQCEAIEQDILIKEALVNDKGCQVMKINKEYHSENKKVRILAEQIHQIKSGPRSLCVIIPKKNIENAFNYESYLKSNKRTITLINQERFSTSKSPKVSPFKDDSNANSQSNKSPAKRITTVTHHANHMKFDCVVSENCNTSFYNYSIDDKLFSEIEVFLKILLYRNSDGILNKLSFDRPEYDKIIEFNNTVDHNLTHFSNIVISQDEEEVSPVKLHNMQNIFCENADSFSNEFSKVQSGFIMFLGDKERGVTQELLGRIFKEIICFKNDVIHIKSIKFKIDIYQNEAHQTLVFEHYQELLGNFEDKIKKILFNKGIVVITLQFEIDHRMIYSLNQSSHGHIYSKKLSLIFLDENRIDNLDIFVRQFKACVAKEKILTTKDKNIEKLEPYIRGVDRHLIIGMFPHVIKLNKSATHKYMKIKDNLELLSKLSR